MEYDDNSDDPRSSSFTPDISDETPPEELVTSEVARTLSGMMPKIKKNRTTFEAVWEVADDHPVVWEELEPFLTSEEAIEGNKWFCKVKTFRDHDENGLLDGMKAQDIWNAIKKLMRERMNPPVQDENSELKKQLNQLNIELALANSQKEKLGKEVEKLSERLKLAEKLREVLLLENMQDQVSNRKKCQ